MKYMTQRYARDQQLICVYMYLGIQQILLYLEILLQVKCYFHKSTVFCH